MRKMLSLIVLLGIMLLSACSTNVAEDIAGQPKALSGTDVVGNLNSPSI